MAEKSALLISGMGANNAIKGVMHELGEALESIGQPVIHTTLDPAQAQYAVDQMSAGRISFAMTWLGFGQDFSVTFGSERRPTNIRELLRVLVSGKYPQSEKNQPQPTNVWDTFGVPLLKLHGDQPYYFIDYHRDIPRNTVNIYGSEEAVYFRRRWLPEAQAITMRFRAMPMTLVDRGQIDMSLRRSGKLFFLKNGNSPTALRQLWHEQLPQSIEHLLVNMVDEIMPIGLKPGILHIGDFVATHLAANDIDPDSVRYLVPFFAAQLDDYLRRIKSTMIAEAILDLPVVVSGSLWEHVDFTGCRAQLIEGQDFAANRKIYAEQLGVIDMAPNVDTTPHDRVCRSAGSYSTVLTNRQGWFGENFPGCSDLTFEFTPESIAARVSDAIAYPDRYLDLGVSFGERFRKLFSREVFAHRILEAVDLAKLRWNNEKPFIQNFFAWRKD